VNELIVYKDSREYTLGLMIWDETGRIHTTWRLGKLNSSEIGFLENRRGGRFRRYRKDIRENKITIRLPTSDKEVMFNRVLGWLGDNTNSDWSLDFTTDLHLYFEGSPDLNLYFENAEEAVLCLLTFR
jgi:hypothetical protein